MTMAEWFLYCLLTLPIVYAPGPMTLFSMANGVRVGYARTCFAIAGGSTAYIIQMTIVALGIGVMLQESPLALKMVKYVGAVYIIYMGIKQWRSAGQPLVHANASRDHSRKRMYIRGFFVGLSNPKALLVFAVLFPQFIKPSANETHQFIILGLTFLIAQFISASTYASVGTRIYAWLRSRNLEKLQGRLFGVMLLVIGLLLLV
jgi:homoserine/homoserine lactone efflux protein